MDSSLTIGIVTFNSGKVIGNCLRTIKQNASDTRIIIVDNDSRDNTHEIISHEFPDVDVFNTGGNFGYAHGVNRILEKSATEFTLILNADIEILPTTITPLLNYMKEHPLCAITAPITYDNNGNLEGNVRIFPTIVRTIAICFLGGTRAEKYGLNDITRDPRDYTESHSVDWLKGAIWCVRTEIARTLHGMREDFFLYSEEREFAGRCIDAGYYSAIVTDTRATHIGGESDSHPVLYSLLHINNVRYEVVRGRRAASIVTFFSQFITEGLRSRQLHHRKAFFSHLRAVFGVRREVHRLVKRLNGEFTRPVFSDPNENK